VHIIQDAGFGDEDLGLDLGDCSVNFLFRSQGLGFRDESLGLDLGDCRAGGCKEGGERAALGASHEWPRSHSSNDSQGSKKGRETLVRVADGPPCDEAGVHRVDKDLFPQQRVIQNLGEEVQS
jgi:hypothetical protein